jgi:glycosyltransferase involved in cell wall biosynthesis
MDRRVRVIRQSNQGAAVARHAGIEAARARVVAFHDSDDVAPPCKLSALLGALNTHPQCVAAFGVTDNGKRHQGQVVPWIEGPLDGRMIVVENPFLWLLSHGGPIAEAMNLAAYREQCRKCSRGRSFYRAANDYDLQIRLALYGQFVHVARVTCLYAAQHVGISISNGFGEFRQGSFALCAADDAYRQSSRTTELREAIRRRVEGEWPRFALGLLLMKDWRLLRHVLGVAARHSRAWNFPRALWWALDGLVDARTRDLPSSVVQAVRVARGLRSGVMRRCYTSV